MWNLVIWAKVVIPPVIKVQVIKCWVWAAVKFNSMPSKHVRVVIIANPTVFCGDFMEESFPYFTNTLFFFDNGFLVRVCHQQGFCL